MGTVYRFLADYEGLVYILLALGALFSLRWLLRSWLELREAVFGLEREYAIRRLSQSIATLALLLVLFVVELVIASFVAPNLPAAATMATPTVDLLASPPGSFQGELGAGVGTAAPAAQPVPPGEGCVPGQLTISAPSPGQEVRSTVEIRGTVNIENFGFYKYEIAPQGADTWATISAGREVIVNGLLGLWDTSVVTPGEYQLRLVAIDNQGIESPPCVIAVRVIAPQ